MNQLIVLSTAGYVGEVAIAVWDLLLRMSPYMLLGFLLAGILHEFVPSRWCVRWLGGKGFRPILLSALLGVPLPLCSCGVIPTAMGLHRDGAGRGATVAFLISTPQTGVDSIVATYSLMGLPFALLRPIVAFVTALFGGWLVSVADHDGEVLVARPVKESDNSCDTCQVSDKEESSLGQRILRALHYAFFEMMEDIGKWLTAGLLVAALITVLVPDDWFVLLRGNSVLSILFVLLFSLPMYLCATGSIPIAVALMWKGLTPGAALVLLMAGPASNAASILVVGKVLGRRTMWLYLLSITCGAVLFGLAVDTLLPTEWFVPRVGSAMSSCHHVSHGIHFTDLSAVVMTVLLCRALLPKLWADMCRLAENGKMASEPTGTSNAPTEASSDALYTYKVEGMHCNHCAASVRQAAESVSGVTSAEVSLEDSLVRIRGSHNETELLTAVRALGFEIDKM